MFAGGCNLIGFGVSSGGEIPITSYANAGGTGDRTASITVTEAIANFPNGVIANLVDGAFGQNSTDSCGFTPSAPSMTDGEYFQFDFGSNKYIDEWKIYVGSITDNGSWFIQGSDSSGSGYVTYQTFTWNTATQTVTVAGVPASGHRYWRMTKNGTSGTYADAWYVEWEFKIAAGA
jgi:hypothetical protein